MYDKILIPVDLSSANEYVFSHARNLAEAGQTDLILFHVVETLQDDEPGEMDEFYEELRAEADKKMKAWAADLSDSGFDVQAEITYGERGPEITRVAEEKEVDLIVQRSHKVDRDAENANVGTISHQVAIFAPCSVLLVRPDDDE